MFVGMHLTTIACIFVFAANESELLQVMTLSCDRLSLLHINPPPDTQPQQSANTVIICTCNTNPLVSCARSAYCSPLLHGSTPDTCIIVTSTGIAPNYQFVLLLHIVFIGKILYERSTSTHILSTLPISDCFGPKDFVS